MIIFWTNESRNRLKDIYDYFSLNVSEKTAKKLINDIIEYSEKLASSPGIGPKEILLNSRTHNYQYLLFGNYKFIYWIKMNVLQEIWLLMLVKFLFKMDLQDTFHLLQKLNSLYIIKNH